MPAHTQCASCRRVVWKTDVDQDGRCVFCVPKTPAIQTVKKTRPEGQRTGDETV